MATQVLDSKLQSEEITIPFDMLSRLEPGEFVISGASAVRVASGIDEFPSLLIPGLPTVSNNIVYQKVVGGLGGVIYLITVAARTNLNNILINEGKLAVLSDTAVSPP